MAQTTEWNIDRVRGLFVNPRGDGDTARLGLMASYITAVLGQIYSDGGASPAVTSLIRGLPEGELGSVMAELLIREAGTRLFDHRFMGQIHPQGNEAALLAKYIAGFMNTNTIVKEVSQAEHAMEHQVLEWLAKVFGYDINAYSGNIVSGGSTANLAALWVARDKLIHKLRTNEGDDYHMRPGMVILASDMAHYSVFKAAHILGENVHVIRVPSRGFRTDVSAMEGQLKALKAAGVDVIAMVGLAGETETGMIDDLAGLADLAEQYQTHFHVDAAYGGPFALVMPEKFTGIQRADSITVDPHKMLYTSYSSAVVLFRNKNDHALVENGARYLQSENNKGIRGPKEERNFGLSARVEGSMGADSVLMAWATLQLFGEAGLRVILQHTLDLTEVAFARASKSNLIRPLHRPETNTLLVEIGKSHESSSAENTRTVRDLLEKDGYYLSVNEEVNGGQAALRMVFMHPWTTSEDVLDMFDKLEAILQQ